MNSIHEIDQKTLELILRLKVHHPTAAFHFTMSKVSLSGV